MDHLKQTQLVYKSQCNQCESIYIGQTKRHVGTRMKEHQRDIIKHVSNHSVVNKISHGKYFNWLEPEIPHKKIIQKSVR